jgi:hypothetical protein
MSVFCFLKQVNLCSQNLFESVETNFLDVVALDDLDGIELA